MQKLCLQAQQAQELVRTTDATLSDTERLVANTLAALVQPDGVAAPSLVFLASLLDRRLATVSRTLLQLEGLGVISRTQRKDGARQRTNHYRFWPAYTGGDPPSNTDPEA